jgi:hypothetical protein
MTIRFGSARRDNLQTRELGVGMRTTAGYVFMNDIIKDIRTGKLEDAADVIGSLAATILEGPSETYSSSDPPELVDRYFKDIARKLFKAITGSDSERDIMDAFSYFDTHVRRKRR